RSQRYGIRGASCGVMTGCTPGLRRVALTQFLQVTGGCAQGCAAVVGVRTAPGSVHSSSAAPGWDVYCVCRDDIDNRPCVTDAITTLGPVAPISQAVDPRWGHERCPPRGEPQSRRHPAKAY